MSKTVEVKLVTNLSYTYKGKKYLRGVPVAVNLDLANYLEKTGKFKIVGKEEKEQPKKKLTIRKPDSETAKFEPESIPTFRSKKELAAYAYENHGIVLSTEDKMVEMRKELMDKLVQKMSGASEDPDAIEV